jgi:RHS repeat-associated protein
MKFLLLFCKRHLSARFIITLLFLGAQLPLHAQCYDNFYIYRTYPYGQLCSPQYAILRAEYFDYGSYISGEFRWYANDTDPNPVSTGYINSDFNQFTSDYTVYANNGTSVWVSFYNENTQSESCRMPYTFFISSSPIVNQDYARQCRNEPAKIQLSSNTPGVTYQLYKLVEYYDPYYGWVQNYQWEQSSTSGYFEVFDFNASTDADKYYVNVYQPYGCSIPYYYQLWFEITGAAPPTIAGNRSVTVGAGGTLYASGAPDFRWYDVSYNLINSGYFYSISPNLTTGEYTYNVQGVSSDGTCLTDFATVTLSVNHPPVSYTPLYNSSNFVKTIDFTKPVGDIDGNVAATASGGVSYSIPIFTSPGTNGVQPSISLAYNSQASSGVAGFGWNLSGLSVISRTGKNMYHNGIVKPLTYTADDAFLLDGMRLNAISGANGANGTIYAGETETFAKIISNTTTSANNPDWFQVTTKDGSIMEFGHSPDSRVTTDNGQSVMLWRMNKIIDVNGNYIEFIYNNSGRDTRIQQILYTGNTNTGLIPYNQVNFSYSVRADQNTGYDAGASLSTKHLLDKITIVHTNDVGATEPVKTYRLNYGFNNLHSMLKEIVEFGGDETAASLNSTIFLYGDDGQDFTSNTSDLLAASSSGGWADILTGDFDADGKTDALVTDFYYNLQGIRYNTGYSIYTNLDGAGVGNFMYNTVFSQEALMMGYNASQISGLITSDYNKDGRDDVLFLSGSTVESGQTFFIDKVVLNTTGSFNSQTGITSFNTQNFSYPIVSDGYYQLTSSSGNTFIPGDFDGDGNSDYILIARNNVTGRYKAFFTSPATAEVNLEILNFGIGNNPYPNSYARTIVEADKIIPIDFDGDGKQDLLIIKNNTTYILTVQRIAPSSGYNFAALIISTTPSINKNCRAYPGDFNGDRKTDLLMHYDNNTWGLLYSNGVFYDANASAFYFQNPVSVYGYNVTDKITVADFNGDGKADILHGYNYFVNGFASTSKLSFYYSRGKASSTPFYYEQYPYNKVLSNIDLITGDFNADGITDLISRYPNESSILYIKPLSQKNLLQKITTGHNSTTTFNYKLLTDKSTYPYFYDRTISLDDPANLNPFNYVQFPMHALSSITAPDGAGGNNITEYAYENAVLHRAAKGFIGFKKVTAKNNVSGISSVTENEINTQFAVPYTVKQITKLTATNQLLSEVQINNSFNNLSASYFDKRYFQKIDKTLSIDYLNGKASEVVNTYDNYGNITNTINKTGILSGSTVNPTETMVSTFSFSIHNTPVPAKPDNLVITSTRVGMPAITTTTTYTYTANGLPASQTNYSGLPKAVTVASNYNNFGNVTSQTLNTAGLPARTTTFQYDTKGRFVVQKQIAAATAIVQTESATFNTKWGKPLTSTSSDCLTSTYEYDAFGNLKQTTMPDGNMATLNFYWHTNSIGVNTSPYKLFYTLTHYSGGKPDTKVYIDKFGREWQTQTATLYKPLATGESPDFHTIQTTFDNRGNVKTKTNPFLPFSGETPRLTTYNYDVYNRLVGTVNDLGTTAIAYSQAGNANFQTTITTPAGQVSTKTTDPSGKIVSSADDGGTLSFTYDSHGNQIAVNHNGTVTVSSIYDIYDKQTSITDKDAGTTSYGYDAFGQLTQQTDANGNMYNMQYDELGRNTLRTGPEGTTTYEYYKDATTGCSNNSLSKVTGFNGVTNEYTYDALKRLTAEKTTITTGVDYTINYGYNAYSQLAYTIYPSGIKINRDYDVNSYVSKVYAEQNTFFANGTVDGEGRYKTYTLLNGLTTTNTYNKDFPASTSTPGIENLSYNFELNTGNLLQRTNIIKNQNEVFTYDNLNRLTTSTVNGVQQFGITYDGNVGNSTMGNIASKTDAGYYKYRDDKIHAIAYTMETPVPGQSPVFPPPISVTPHTLQELTYTPFLKTATITEGGLQLGFTYGPGYQRIKTELTQNGNLLETRYFLGDYEKQVANGITREIYYVNGPNGLCGMIVAEGGVNNYYTVYADYLGSITKVVFGTNQVVAEQNFDAWGRQRDPDNWNTYLPVGSTPTTPAWLYRGYTGHEMLPQFSLINMNGRMYDPVAGRMLSPDNYVSTPLGSQGYNRYIYAMNNPLKFTDPDGNWVHLVIGAIVGGVINLVSGAIQGNINSWGDGFKAFGIGAIQGALSAAIGYGGFGSAAAGRAVTGGFLTSATSVGANLTSTAFLGNIATGIASSFIPSIPFGDNFSVRPSFAFGTHGLSSGLSATYRKGNFSISAGFSNGGNNRRFSYGGGWDDGHTGFSYMHNKFYGQYPQTTGTVGFHADRISGSWENDLFGFGGTKDRWRTNGMSLSYGFSNGSSLSVASRFMTGEDNDKELGIRTRYPNEYGEHSSTLQRQGLFYLNYTNANGLSTSIGIDDEKGRYNIMRVIHSITGDGVFKNLQSSYPLSGFTRYGNANPFTYFY